MIMKLSALFLLCLLLALGAAAQKSTSRSRTGGLAPKKTQEQVPENPVVQKTAEKETAINKTDGEVVPLPPAGDQGAMEYQTPFLTAAIDFTDPNGNNMLDAGEEWLFTIKITNTGKMAAEICQPELVREVNNPYISVSPLAAIARISPGDSRELTVRVKASEEVITGKTPVKFRVLESRGFDLEPELRLTIPTRAFQPPVLEFSEYVIQDQNRNSRIERREIVDVIFRIRNQGESVARGCVAVVTPGANVLAVDVPDQYDLGDIPPGEFRDITASVVTNARTTEVTMTLVLRETTGLYGGQRLFTMPFDVVQKKPEELSINAPVVAERAAGPGVTNLKLDIAENIPETTHPRPESIAVIIGNRDYQKAPPVDFALNDARIVKNYVRKSLGYSEANILERENARQSDLFSIFGNESNHRGQLYNYAIKGKSELFVYYSGHGAPDPNTGQGYLVPVDCDPNTVALNGYPLNLLFANLQKVIEEKQIGHATVVLDACFSGGSEKGNLLTNVSPVSIRLKEQETGSDRITVFTSSSGDQLSNWYPAMRQGLYTYFFLKGLKGEADIDRNHVITAIELHQYVADEVSGVPYWAKRLHDGRNQTPTMKGDPAQVIFK